MPDGMRMRSSLLRKASRKPEKREDPSSLEVRRSWIRNPERPFRDSRPDEDHAPSPSWNVACLTEAGNLRECLGAGRSFPSLHFQRRSHTILVGHSRKLGDHGRNGGHIDHVINRGRVVDYVDRVTKTEMDRANDVRRAKVLQQFVANIP